MPDALIAVAADEAEGRLEDQALIEAVGTSEGWRDWSRLAKVEIGQEPAIHVDAHGMALDLAVHGVGVALTSSLLASQVLKSGQAVQAHPTALPSSEGYFLAVKTRSEHARAFEDWLKSVVAQDGAKA